MGQLVRAAVVGGSPSHNNQRADALLRLGSDCSGYGSDFLALKQCGVNVRTIFCAEIDANKVNMLAKTHAIHDDLDYTLDGDIKTRYCNCNAQVRYVCLMRPVSGFQLCRQRCWAP